MAHIISYHFIIFPQKREQSYRWTPEAPDFQNTSGVLQPEVRNSELPDLRGASLLAIFFRLSWGYPTNAGYLNGTSSHRMAEYDELGLAIVFGLWGPPRYPRSKETLANSHIKLTFTIINGLAGPSDAPVLLRPQYVKVVAQCSSAFRERHVSNHHSQWHSNGMLDVDRRTCKSWSGLYCTPFQGPIMSVKKTMRRHGEGRVTWASSNLLISNKVPDSLGISWRGCTWRLSSNPSMKNFWEKPTF